MRGRAPFDRRNANAIAPGGRLQVLAVADSPIARQLIASSLAKEPDLAVMTAFDWAQALQRLDVSRPDVVALCSERLWPDDAEARSFHEQKIPVVVGSLDVRDEDPQPGLIALVARLRESSRPPRGALPNDDGAPSGRAAPPAVPTTANIVAIGASAGGTMAI